MTPCRTRLLVIRNPAAGRARCRRFEAVLRNLRDCGCRITLRETHRRGDAELYARAATPAEYDAVVAAGGDGTVNEVVNGLVGRGVALAVVPLGTANVLATEIGLALDPATVARTILAGTACTIRLGLANDRRFVMMAGVGFDAHVVRRIRPGWKRWLGRGAYVLESLREILRHDRTRFAVELDGEPADAASLVAANGRHYAGAYLVAPEASLAAPVLQILLFQRDGRWNCIRYGLALLANRLPALPDVRIVEARRILITGPADDPVQGDGDIVAQLPVSIAIAPETIDLIVPDATARQLMGARRSSGGRSPLRPGGSPAA